MSVVETSASPGPEAPAGSITPPSGASREHCLYCFDVLAAKLKGDKAPAAQFGDRLEQFPLFVTWNIESSRGGYRLRGCIGNFEPMVLGDGLAEYAIVAAMRDHRFAPISLKELSRLECGVSLLTQFEECADAYDWVLGTHGVYIHLYENKASPRRKSSTSSKGSRSLIQRGPGVLTATFLPDVAPAQGWNQVETLDAAIRKSGFDGPIDEALRSSLRVLRYQSTKEHVSYSDWKSARG